MEEIPNRWEGVYRVKEEAETSWFEDRPRVPLDLIGATGAERDAAIVDVGAGSSRLVDCLLERGFRRITVLDLSETALARIRRTMLLGTAKPIPSEPPSREKIAVLTPTSLPSMATSAPPELPGFMAASV